ASLEEICHYIRTQCDAHTYNYAISYYCSNPSLNGNHFMRLLRLKFTSVSFVFAYLVVLFISLGITASDYLCPNLNYATVYLNLSQRVAGMTLMAYGNGAPDLFSSYSLIKSGSPELAFGELIGAANFCVCFVIGAMGICNSFEVDPPQFLCDVGFFIALLIISLVFICDGKLTLLESGIMIILYASYILFLVKYNFSNEPLEEIDENSTLLSPYAPPHASLRPLTPTSSVLSPMASPNQASQSVMRFSVYDAVKLWSHLGDLRCGMSKESLLQENYDATEEQEAAGGDQIQQGVPSHDRPSTQISPSDLREIIHHSPFAYKVFFLPILVDYHYFSLKDEISQWWGEYPGSIIPKSMHLIILAAVSLALVVLHHWYYRHCSQSHSQDHQGLHHYYHNRLPPIIAFLGFFLSIVWINIISDHVVLLLKNIGLMYRIGDSLLGLTVFATGNSVGDLIGNVTLARSHLSLTGLGACFGAPLLYILLGLGLNGVILITTTRQGRPIEFKFDISLIVGSAGVLGMLVVYLVVVPMNGWVIGRKLGIFAVLWWGIITGINVYLDY
ncbi:hypothetical protein BABINDRAFT_21218, partial [Babjeviella inositovora NRRL Y-12698]